MIIFSKFNLSNYIIYKENSCVNTIQIYESTTSNSSIFGCYISYNITLIPTHLNTGYYDKSPFSYCIEQPINLNSKHKFICKVTRYEFLSGASPHHLLPPDTPIILL